jgi:acyl-CoA synthetase (AMP-forming)/AMP-acid ligase II
VTDWNFADVWETVAETVPDGLSAIHGERRLTWAETERRANGVAQFLLELGVAHQDKVAHYLYNGPEYMESTFAILKDGLVPVNTNYRYTDDELVYLWDNADAVAVIFHGVFSQRIAGLRPRVPLVRAWLWVDDGTDECPSWATPYEAAAESGAPRPTPSWARTGDDLYFLYTGGTTGMPKGVMWRQDDLFARLNAGNLLRVPEDGGTDGVRKTIVGPGPLHLPACPLMHGTGGFTAMAAMTVGGCIVTLTNRHFDPVELLDTIDRDNVNTVAIVGDAFAKPILRALDEHPGRWRLSTLLAFVSSGVMWSEETKRGLLHHHPNLMLIDAFSSSEAIGMGTSMSSGSAAEHTARFNLSPEVRVLDPESNKDVTPGSGEVGVLALGGRNPVGYYKDPDKSSATFKEIDGTRYSVPGDFATVDEDGAIHLLGRGSVVINTGGEKVFPEEVEEVLKIHPSVADAVAVAIPDERFGQAVAAAVELRPGTSVTEAELIEHVRARLAAFKAPKRVHFVETIGRSPAGKVDYTRVRTETTEWASTSI